MTTTDTKVSDNTGVDGSKPLLRNSDYLRWFASDVAADTGDAIRAFAMPLIALAVTGSLSLAGVVGAVSMASSLLATLPGGVVADRVDRKRLMALGHGLGALIWISAVIIYFTGYLSTSVLFILAAVAGFRGGFFAGVSIPVLRMLVQPEQLPRALAANQARDGTIRVVSGPLGGLLVAFSVWFPFAVQAVGHVAAWFFSVSIKADLRPQSGLGEGESLPRVTEQLRAGIAWLREHLALTLLLVIAAVVSLASNGVLQTIILALGALGEHGARIGIVSTALAVGMIAGSLIAGPLASRAPTGKLAIGSIMASALTLMPLLVVRDFWVILTCVGLFGLTVPLFNAAASGWAIAQIPRTQIGSITSAAALINGGLLPLGPLLAGIGLEMVGFGGTLAVFIALEAIGAVCMLFIPQFRRLGKPSEWNLEPA
ncbi:MAG: MFS transporter [Actinomycetaceae bacterium]|nr:MFS transporter [Actinomycetaceae bacterium]